MAKTPESICLEILNTLATQSHARYVCKLMLNDHVTGVGIHLIYQGRKPYDLSTSKNITIIIHNHNATFFCLVC